MIDVYEIIDDKGTIFSGNEDEMISKFQGIKRGEFQAADCFELQGDVKLVKVLDIYR